jgi:hypothetical protein
MQGCGEVREKAKGRLIAALGLRMPAFGRPCYRAVQKHFFMSAGGFAR